MTAQRDLIRRMQSSGVLDAKELISLTASPQSSPVKATFANRPASPPNTSTLTHRFREVRIDADMSTRTSKGSESSTSSTSSNSPGKRELGFNSPIRDRYALNEFSPTKKYRRTTIEQDMEKLATEKPVERSRCAICACFRYFANHSRLDLYC